ncbi:hypothetical protein YC2023_010826 [Brassica napus]
MNILHINNSLSPLDPTLASSSQLLELSLYSSTITASSNAAAINFSESFASSSPCSAPPSNISSL